MTTVTIDRAVIEQAVEALANVEVAGPDDDGVIWINLPGNGVTGKAILRVGKSGLIAAQCATLFDEQRVGAIAALRAALAEPAVEPFGYFRAEPFGWTDCAPTDEGAKALYEAPPPAQPVVEPVAYRYKYLNFMGDEVWSQDMPRNGKVLETQELFASPPPPAEPAAWRGRMLGEEEWTLYEIDPTGTQGVDVVEPLTPPTDSGFYGRAAARQALRIKELEKQLDSLVPVGKVIEVHIPTNKRVVLYTEHLNLPVGTELCILPTKETK